MKNKTIKILSRSYIEKYNLYILIILPFIIIYFLFSLFFINHYQFNTQINGVDVSLKSNDEIKDLFLDHINNYELKLIERSGMTEIISVKYLGIYYNNKNSASDVYKIQNSVLWIISLFKIQRFYINDLYAFNHEIFENKINDLNCLNHEIIKPKNASFLYVNGSYKIIKEILGNKINKDLLKEKIKLSILLGERILNLDKDNCYENPKYTMVSDKAMETYYMLNKYLNTKITYLFATRKEILDKNITNRWFKINEDLEVYIDKTEVLDYVKSLSKKYDTMGHTRKFKTSTDKTVEVKGGLYGWKIDAWAETEALIDNIILGEVREKEPIYIQKARSRDENDIGDTYVEINISKQLLWLYKNGKLIVQSNIVSGNPNKEHQTVLGTYALNYKQENAILTGEDYETNVNYWMPFYGNIGIHDAKWRYEFGKEIYKHSGSHGCVNVPLYVAKIIFENIEPGIPIVCYEE
ncbi:L,D-transpeptidase family protein [Sedimentibacter saalensis]|uniref:Putative peptidoglycan binding protein n=1 Tax=Sedimentibacter saalensis TaxID=130788 RepID=A0A562JI92_9FIRM|nr:L,D-transpeptidase family protein [Sedimentibacter saalensis]TWH82554.1 putative peptidoglycan binding protein [Sedimentibacter saalensis]